MVTRLAQGWVDELSLAAVAMRCDHGVPGDFGGNGSPVVLAHHMQAEVQSGRYTGAGQHVPIVDVDHARVDLHRREHPGQDVAHRPMEVADPMRSSSREVLSRRELLQHGALATGGLLAVDAFGLLVRQPGAAADPGVGPTMPRTRLTDAAERLLQETSPQFLIDHCHRSIELAMLIVEAGGIDLDDEVLVVGILLHDLGLTARFHSSEVRFEVASANGARDLARSYGMSRGRAEKVWDVAALHATGGISDFKSPRDRRRLRRHREGRRRIWP